MAAAFSHRVGAAVRSVAGEWYGPHMAAAARAIRHRAPLVDLVLEVRDARIPSTSAFAPLGHHSAGSEKHLVVLNKVDLADRSATEKWMVHMKQKGCSCVGVNSHNKESIKELLSIVQTRIKEVKFGESNCIGTVLLVGIPNVGKSAIVNAMHQTGRISAAEKGKLKHAIVSSHPGETKDISGYKVASHPNIYVLDTPGVLSPKIVDGVAGSKLALTGAINDPSLQECEVAQFFLAILNSSGKYRKWENLNNIWRDEFSSDKNLTSGIHQKKGQHASDHTQDFIVKAVRQTLFKTIFSFEGNLGKENELGRLIECQFLSLKEAFRVPAESSEDWHKHVAAKLLNLYRTGRLGRYTLDQVPDVRLEVAA